jgi:hypothetical protein
MASGRSAPATSAPRPRTGGRRSLAGERRGDICTVLAAAASRAFDLLEPSLGGYGIRPAR